VDDELREMARQALADVDPDGPGGVRMQAVKLLRERDDKRHRMEDYIGAVNWALEHPRAADLPARSVVASTETVFIKTDPTGRMPWACSDLGRATDEAIDRYLGLGARVLRVGTGEG
jgi:hypothetical protein